MLVCTGLLFRCPVEWAVYRKSTSHSRGRDKDQIHKRLQYAHSGRVIMDADSVPAPVSAERIQYLS